ncbi:TPA: hypothetical protein ACH3X1_015414 [Trebouxia sp. C0004]
MKLSSWPKAGHICKKKQTKQAHAVCHKGSQLSSPKQQLPKTEQSDLSFCKDCYSQGKGAAEAQCLLPKTPSFLKRLVTFPLKALCTRSGAEVHDSAGLEQAVAYYVSATLHGEDSLWPGEPHDPARHMWV